MKNFTLRASVLAFFMITFGFAQDKGAKKLLNQDLTPANERSLDQTGHIRCGSVEYEQYLQEKYPNRQTNAEFENWLESKKQETINQRMASPNVVQTIPIVFHIFTDGSGAENVSAALIQAQVDQLNIDYRNLAGSIFAQAGDAQVEFCLAQQDESGNPLAENGINRITSYGQGPFSQTDFENSMKAATQWDPTKYFNVWVADISGGLLGYAQFPNNTTILDLPSYAGPANTDGVVVLYSSVGSVANPNPNGGQYANGRTLTHEAGHWLGLRHIWGDSANCTNDDYCADTPDANTEHYSCGVYDTCPSDGLGNDMVENYMDYTNDTCMDTFTADQVTRILTVLANSPRRVELVTTSTVCQPAQIFNLDGSIDINNLNLNNCDGSIAPEIIITNKGNNQLTSATISYYLDSDTPSTYNWTGSLAIDESATVGLPTVSVTSTTHTFNVELVNPNGGTDEQLLNNTAATDFDVTGALCTSVANTTYQTSTTGVVFNTISNLNTGKPSGYSDYTSISTDVNIDSSYDLTVNVNTDGTYTTYTTVWIDWNHNCSFDDAGEEYDLGTAYNVANGATGNSPLSITVPSDASLGTTTMRVSTKYDTAATACENGHDAEVEDYAINVLASLSSKDYTLENLVTLYPNPVNDQLTIKFSNNDLPEGYTIYNMLGQVVSQKHVSNITDLTVNTTSLSSGMYFVKIAKDNQSATLPFIKN